MFASLLFVFIVPSLTFVTVDAENITHSDHEADDCLLPPYPEHGRYTVSNKPSAIPGERYPSVKLDISCDTGYHTNNTVKNILCINAYWSAIMPTCVRDLHMLGFCTVPTDDLKYEFRCDYSPASLTSSQERVSFVASGTICTPICRSPGYFSLKVLPEMHCTDGFWDYIPICKPACGLTAQHRQLEGTSSNHPQLPWHAVIYGTGLQSHKQKCGGSLISATKIISAAQYFFDANDNRRPASDFVVTVNKLYRSYYDSRDVNSQHSDVVDIIIPSSFQGSATFYQDDIAIAVVKTPFLFHLSVRPVCLDFDESLDRTQLIEGNPGKTVRWTSAGDKDQKSEVLNVVDLPYKNSKDCYNSLWATHKRYLTNEKFCTVYNSVKWPSTRDIGGGLAFLESTTQRYYLRGVLSIGYISAEDKTIRNIYTSIVKHKQFIERHLLHEQEANKCLLPPHPEHGRYTVSRYPYSTPGERYSKVKLEISCETGYLSNTIKSIFCINGNWSASMPTCVRDLPGLCTLATDDPSVSYHCLSFLGKLKRSRECESVVPSGTRVRPICRVDQAYFSFSVLPEMNCKDGIRDYKPICEPAAHCFYNDNKELLPASDFVVAVNKMYDNYNDIRDRNRQYSGVTDFKIPSSFRGEAAYREDDIAIAVVKPFFYHLSVQPVCLNFDKSLDSTQLIEGNSGKALNWSVIDVNDPSSRVLNVFDNPYVKNEECENMLHTDYRRYLTKDKFCTRYNHGTWLDNPEEGGGIAFLDSTTQRYYLRGVASLNLIGSGTTIMYTSIVKHEHFIKEHL